MSRKEKVLRDLSELADSYLSGFPFSLIVVEGKYILLIALVMIKVIVLFSYLVRSFVAKYQVDPMMKVVAHNLAFKHFAHLEDKFLGSTGPWRQDNRMNLITFLLTA